MSVREPVLDTAPGGPAIPAGMSDAPATVAGRESPSPDRRGRWGLAGLMLSGAIVSLAAAHTESLLPVTSRPALGSLAGVFGGLDLNLHVAGAIGVLVLMFGSYALVVCSPTSVSARTVLSAIVALHVLVLIGPPLISTDVFSYQAYARMGADFRVNPYTHGPYAINYDPIFPYVGAKWSYIPSVYGPLFTTFSYLLAPLGIAASVLSLSRRSQRRLKPRNSWWQCCGTRRRAAGAQPGPDRRGAVRPEPAGGRLRRRRRA